MKRGVKTYSDSSPHPVIFKPLVTEESGRQLQDPSCDEHHHLLLLSIFILDFTGSSFLVFLDLMLHSVTLIYPHSSGCGHKNIW